MPPHRTDIPANPPEQGALFDVGVVPTGITDHVAVGKVVIGELGPDGVYPSDTVEAQPDEVVSVAQLVAEVALRAAKTRTRSEAQRGKHSALGRDGLYHPWIGSVMPGFGVVRERNWDAAKKHAERRNTEILRLRRMQPSLGETDYADDVLEAVAHVSVRLDIASGLEAERPESTVPPLATTQDKIMVLRNARGAGYIPTTNREKNQGFELLDYMSDPQKYPKGAGQRLDEIFYHQQTVQQALGKAPQHALEIAVDTVRSVVNEWGDYAENAIHSIKALEEIRRAINGLGHNQRLGVAFADGEGGYVYDFRPLVRYFDLQALPYYPGDKARDSLTTRTDRQHVSGQANKRVEDEYTRTDMSDEYAIRIDAVLRVMRVEDAFNLLPRAIEDQKNRAAFWNSALENANAAGDFRVQVEQVIKRIDTV